MITINLVKVISTATNAATQLLVKVLRKGKNDVQTPYQALPYGIDSNPIKDMVAVYCKTESDGSTMLIGYLNKNVVAKVGESRLFSTDENGALKYNVWTRNDGTLLLGTSDNPAQYTNFGVMFNELKTEFNALKKSHNDLLAEYKTHVHPGVTVGSGATGATISTQVPNNSNIDNAKNQNIKTN